MKSSTFWERKRAELQPQRPTPSQNQNNLPWWQDADLTQLRKDEPTGPLPAVQDNHDYSRADHLKSRSGNCPNCGSSSFLKPSASAASRCFECGYIQGREVNDLNTMDITVNESAAPRLKIRQTADGGAQKYRARISRSADEIRMANAQLESSFTGRAHVDE